MEQKKDTFLEFFFFLWGRETNYCCQSNTGAAKSNQNMISKQTNVECWLSGIIYASYILHIHVCMCVCMCVNVYVGTVCETRGSKEKLWFTSFVWYEERPLFSLCSDR